MDDPVIDIFAANAVLQEERIEKPSYEHPRLIAYVFREDDPELPLPGLESDRVEERRLKERVKAHDSGTSPLPVVRDDDGGGAVGADGIPYDSLE